jgi:hypothetical protein
MYAYVRNNPTTLTDPSGTCAISCYIPFGGMTMAGGDISVMPDPEGLVNAEENSEHRIADPTVAAQEQQRQAVVFSDNANPTPYQPTPGGAADRTVLYRGGEMDEKGNVRVDSSATLTLHEKLDPSSEEKSPHIAEPPQTRKSEFEDYQYVPANHSYRVLRDWKVNGEPASVYDKATKQTYRYEVTTFDANSKVAIKTEVTNEAPF